MDLGANRADARSETEPFDVVKGHFCHGAICRLLESVDEGVDCSLQFEPLRFCLLDGH